jgi:hypothetical protein
MLKCSRANNKQSCFLRKKGRLLKLKYVSVLAVFNQIQDNAASVNYNRHSGAFCGYKSINDFQRFSTFFRRTSSISRREQQPESLNDCTITFSKTEQTLSLNKLSKKGETEVKQLHYFHGFISKRGGGQ